MIRKVLCFNYLALALLIAFFFIYPPIRAALDIRDPALRGPGIPQSAWRLYGNLTPRYARWAESRVAEGRAESLSTGDISGTEWPLFGSVFYLWAIENLQSAWDTGDHSGGREPKAFAKTAIIAASELVIDPKHASWVKKHWGADYLHRQNVFYRMLVIAALTSREKLLHDHAHLDLLRDQVETFAKELDASASGLLEDYPSQCYPADVMAALMCIKRADAVLGTDHSEMLDRALRGFTGRNATGYLLPPYLANANSGAPESGPRGCASSYMCITSPELWPNQARLWYALYDRYFWQERFTFAGYREYPRFVPNSNWTVDVDGGPVIAGFGVSACAFGAGAARKNGRFDRAYPLATEMLASVGELPNGVLFMPRLLSNLSDAPMLGEAGILWQLTIQPEPGFRVARGGTIPTYVYIVLSAILLFGVWRLLDALWKFWRALRSREPAVAAPRFQIAVWACLMAASLIAFALGHPVTGTIVFIAGVMLPVTKREKRLKGTEGWDDAVAASAPASKPDSESRE